MADYNSIYTGAQIDSAIGAALTALQPSDISAFESTTQLNNRDIANQIRSNHTGTQLASTISDFETAVDNLTLDSADVLGLIDSAHVQLRQDYAYASLTDAPNVLDSADVSLIAGGLSGWGGDSATVLGLIDSDHVQLRQDYAYGSLSGAPTALSAFINDTLFLDSDTATQLIDSAYVQLRQSIVGSGGVDSAAVIGLIDSDYVQLRQDYAYGSLTDAPNVLDSADVALIAGDAGVDSATVLGLIDSAHVQLRQDYAYASLTGSPNVLDSADVSTIAGSLSGLDAAGVTALVDSDYVQLRQDYAYGSLTDAPNVLDSADVSLIAGSSAGVDSATVLGLIDSDHVQLRQDYAYASLTGTPNVLDSADVSSIAGGLSGVDSAYVATQINALIDGAPGALDTLNEIAIALNNDSDAYNTLLSKIDSNGTALSSKLDTNQSLSLITTTVDSAYVQLRQSSVGPATFADLTEISLADLDVHDIAVPATSVHVITPNGSSAYRSDIHGTTDNPTLYVSAGETIAFDLTGVTGSHPFEIRSDASTAYNTGLIHIAPDGTRTTGSSAQGKTSGTLYWKVPGSISGTYKYRCTNHSGMIGDIIIDDPSADLDSAAVIGLIDSDYIQLRQDYAYGSLTGTPNVLDSADVSSIAGGLSGLDAAAVTALVDSDYVQLRQDYAYASLTGAPNVLDSADVSTIAGSSAGVDSATVLGLIDSAHVQLRQDYAHASLTGSPNVLDSADVSLIAGGLSGVDSAYVTARIDALIDGAPGALNTLNELAAAINDDSQAYNTLLSLVNGKLDSADAITLITTTVDSAYVQLRQSIVGSGGVDSATVLGLIDSAHVQLRQDYAYGSLTGVPNVLDSADVSLIAGSSAGIDSAAVIGLIDSDYIQLRQDYAYASLTGVPNVLDSADVSAIAGSGGGGVDSATVLGLIDSAHIQSKITSSTIYTRTITTATAGQTVFAATYTPNYVDVFINGIKILDTTDFTATNGTSVTLINTPSSVGDIVEITAWVPTAVVTPVVLDTVFSYYFINAGNFTGPVEGTKNITPTKDITLLNLSATIDAAVGSSIIFDVEKNDSAIQSFAITSGQTDITASFNSGLTFTDSDIISVDITSGSGKDLVVKINYKET